MFTHQEKVFVVVFTLRSVKFKKKKINVFTVQKTFMTVNFEGFQQFLYLHCFTFLLAEKKNCSATIKKYGKIPDSIEEGILVRKISEKSESSQC